LPLQARVPFGAIGLVLLYGEAQLEEQAAATLPMCPGGG
jgi:hypothetical protein